MKKISNNQIIYSNNDQELLCLQHEKLPLSAEGALEKVSFC